MQVDESCNVELQDDFFVNSIAGKSKRFDALASVGWPGAFAIYAPPDLMRWMEMEEFLQWEWVRGSMGVVLHSNRAVQAFSRFPKRNMVVGQKVIH